MATLATLELEATLGGADPLQQMRLDASINAGTIDEATLARLDGSLDLALGPALVPVGDDRSQVVGGFRVYVDGALVPPARVLPEASYAETLDGAVVFSFSVSARSSEPVEGDPIGDAIECKGPPPGDALINVDFVYLTASGPRAVRLITSGVVDSSTRAWGPDGAIRTVQVFGTVGRYVEALVEVEIPPGAGLTALEQTTMILAEMGLPAPRVVEPRSWPRLRREVSVRDESGYRLIQRILEPWGRLLIFDRQGLPVVIPKRQARTVVWGVGSSSVLSAVGARQEESDSAGPTHVCVQAVEQTSFEASDFELRQTISSQTGLGTFNVSWHPFRTISRAPVQVYEIPYEVVTATIRQQTNGDQDPASPAHQVFTAEPGAKTFERRVKQSFDFCTLAVEDSETWAYYAVESATQRLVAGSPTYLLAWILDDTSQRGMLDAVERFQRIERTLKRRAFDDDGRLIAEQVDRYSWYARRKATEEWDGIAGDFAVIDSEPIYLFRGTDGVTPPSTGGADIHENFILTERSLVVHDVTDDGYVTRKTTEESAWFAPPSAPGDGTFRYADGRVSKDNAERFDLYRVTVELFEPLSGDSSHRRTTIETVADDPTKHTEVSSAEPGYLPAATTRDDVIPDPSLYPNGVPTCLDGSRQIEGCWTAESLAAKRRTLERRISNDRVESAEVARDLARQIIRDESTIGVSVPVPINAAMKTGDYADVTAPEEGLAYTSARITGLEHRTSPEGAYTQLFGEVDVL